MESSPRMQDELSRLASQVEALARRERALLLWQLALRTAALIGLTALAAVAAAVLDVARPQAAAWLVLALGAGLFALVAVPWLRGWTAAGDVLRQARLVEAREPRLRGRLVTALGHLDGPRGAESPALLGLVARRALGLTEQHPPAEVHPSTRVRRWLAGASGAWVLAVSALLLAPGGTGSVASWWLGDAGARAAALLGAADGAAPGVRVGDLTLRYVYPAYTGLEPYEVVNSTGEAHAVPGTKVEVVARTAEPVESASLVAYDDPALDARVEGGRRVTGSFTVQAREGAYHLVTLRDGETKRSAAFPITPEPDLPPEVALDTVETVIERAVDEPIGLSWTASDDYGVTRVAIELDGVVREPALRRIRGRDGEVTDVLSLRPADLDLVEGGNHRLAIVAWDNDAVSGSKQGRSQVVELQVVGADGVARLTEARRAELLDLLVDLLGDHLEDAFPPGRAASAWVRWGETVSERYADLQAFVDTYRGNRGRGPEWGPVTWALESGTTLVRYTQVSFRPDDRSPAQTDLTEAVVGFRDEAVAGVEAAALHVDRLIQARIIRDLAMETETLAAEAEELEAALAADEVDPQGLLVQADGIDVYMAELREMAAELRRGGLRDLVEARTDEADHLLSEAMDSLGAGDVEQSRELMARTAQRLDELASGIQEELERRREQQKKGESKAQQLQEVLEQLARDQAALTAEVADIRERERESLREALGDLWERAEAKAAEVVESIGTYRDDLESAGRRQRDLVLADESRDRAEVAREAAEARDLTGLLGVALDLRGGWAYHASEVERLAASGFPMPGPGRARILDVSRRIDELLDLAEQLRRTSRASDPAVQAAVQQLQGRQRDLLSQLDDAKRDAKAVVQEMQVTPRALEPALERAGERMEQASAELRQGNAMQAQGSEQAAGQHLREAIEALQQARQQAAQQANEMRERGQGDNSDSEGARERDGDNQQPRGFELPEPEEFQTPEAYRRALLQGMQGEVPEEYRALKKRYYEELVIQ